MKKHTLILALVAGSLAACSSDVEHVENQMESIQEEVVATELIEELETVTEINDEVNALSQEIDELLEEL